MSETRKKADWPIVAGLLAAVVLVAIGFYAWGYFAVGLATKDNLGDRVRVYEYNWQVTLFGPAAKIESTCIDDSVWLRGPD